jgi:hypothetical protein
MSFFRNVAAIAITLSIITCIVYLLIQAGIVAVIVSAIGLAVLRGVYKGLEAEWYEGLIGVLLGIGLLGLIISIVH